jgi:Plasmid pRiA4b ORF-3-like protein
MLIYRFRLTSEEQEDFIREIEIQPTQTFLDFHEIILSCTELESCQNAFFYTTDKKCKKHQEISFKQQKKKIRKYDDELDEIITEVKVLHLMKNSRLNAFIDDPHQKMIYEYQGKDFHSFNLELFKIIKSEESILLPRYVKSIGTLPKRVEIQLEPMLAPAEGEGPIHPPLTPLIRESIFGGIHENESEIVEIESHLEEILEKEEKDVQSNGTPSLDMGENEMFAIEEEVEMESIEDYEDIENFEIKHRKFDGDSDEF